MNKILVYSVGALLSLFCGCGSREKAVTGELNKAIHVKVFSIESIKTAEPIETSGQVRAKEEINPSFKTGGIVSRVYVGEGQRVAKGQLLASLDQTEIAAQVSLVKSNVEKTERDLIRVKNLYADSAATLEQVQNLITAYNIAKENLTSAQFNLSHSEIRSPCNGIVAEKWKNEGELIPAGNPMFTLFEVNNNAWIVKSGVSDKDKVKIKLKDAVEITLDAFPDKSLTGNLTQIAEKPDPINGLYTVEVSLNPINVSLTSGYFARLRILPSVTQQLCVVPIEAILETVGRKGFVYTVDKISSSVVKKEVYISYIDNSKAYIISGLDNTDNVVIKGISFIENGSKVIIDK